MAIMRVSPIEIAEIPKARSPDPGIKPIKPLDLTPPKTIDSVGPGTFEIATVALLEAHQVI